ncbi:uncharacterized protein LOC110100716 [Dendrobium catenatum]|uniref:Uncharacterized protein n=1 Tax=Dendrobium catenatum TaxID=906689 RepID=A0A2I0VWQ3_9ASPA|nr:uncharacterized protein LOC110100716 [Dendrobium catenatum]XP_028555412.1 uncharacterized protein LOC110100716 [Dendrobium catenatum]PKU67840.1 hypothetical protein MA16_Dca018348 [Dendrobium catenatum]
MVSMDLQIQGPHPSLFLRPKSCKRGINLGSFASFHVSRRDNFVSLKHRLCLSAHSVLAKRRTLMVLSFKGNSQNDGSDSRHRSSRLAKAPFQLSPTQKEIEETTTESFDAQNHLSFESQEREDSNGGSLAIQKLFRKWLIMLTTQTSSPKVCEAFEEKPFKSEVPEYKQVTVSSKALKLLQVSFMYFLRLDASISLPLVIFIPWFLTIRIVYGAEVTKELTPLWIIGPLVLALYINIIKGLCSLYTFCFMQAVNLVKNLPAYCLLLHSYIVEGKLQSTLWFYLIKPFADIKNMDHKEFFRSKIKQVQGWAVDKYLDCIESIWPYYCRTIRFLKKANLI